MVIQEISNSCQGLLCAPNFYQKSREIGKTKGISGIFKGLQKKFTLAINGLGPGFRPILIHSFIYGH